MHGGEIAIPIVMFVTLFSMISWIVWVGEKTRRERYRALAEVQNHMLQRFGSAQEFTEFLRSTEGRRFLQPFLSVRVDPTERILKGLQRGVILTVLGIAFLGLTAAMGDEWEPFLVIGSLLLALGIGFGASSALAYRLSRSWGLLSEHRQEVTPIETQA